VAKINHLSVDSALVRPAGEFSAADPSLKDLEIYLVPFNRRAETFAERLNKHFRSLDLKITSLAPVSLDVNGPCNESARRSCPDAESFLSAMERAYPRVARNRKAIMIGLVDDMIVSEAKLIRPCAYRSTARTAVIALASLDPVTYCEPENDEVFEARLERALESEIVMLARMRQVPNPSQSAYLNFNGCAYILNQN
jgi:hypothetical protein